MSELQLKEVREVVREARASSAPGPSGTSFKVYKYCPKLLLCLWYILRVFWRRGRIPDQWRVDEGVWIPKEENSTQLDQFRIISLLCVEAKVFFSAVSKRLCTYLAENTYIDTSVQKGGISGMPGCLEHTGVVTQLIREARENKGNLSVLWLDLENALGSIPHKLVQFTLTKHHVPSRCRDLIADYYSNFRMRVSSGAITSSWHKVEIGIITGCTISVTLFSLAMNMLTKSAEPECRGPRTNSGQRQPPIRAFMDDLTVMTESVPGCRWILKGLEELVEWARMRFKPAKSRSMVLRKGKVVDKFRFNIADTAIPSISEKPVKSLGKVFDCSLRDTTSIQSTCTELDGWLKSVDKSGLPGKFKAWVYQHAILPRILRPLLVYAVPISTVETLERRFDKWRFVVTLVVCLCHALSHGVNQGSGLKILFGSGTNLLVESKPPSFYKLEGSNGTRACLALDFSSAAGAKEGDSLFNGSEPSRARGQDFYSQVALYNETDTCPEDSEVNSLSLLTLALRILFFKAIAFNVLMTLRLWIH
ncbi:hypothetical protein NHX12_004104 [Muraenolepis orangiensis]|uniref:Reverse transcriptase domain-containing protein n=1 Tax=Muraenolepis orangiensis TaxID=630683 RepID=A0A9Q0DWE7_9TELE|nr:hypothetical protein NHX12_004104 [Muraenolepis orangiensis]